MLIPLPPWRKVRVDRVPGKVRITTAPKRRLVAWAVFLAALILWASGGVNAYAQLAEARNANRRAWIAAWLCVWTLWGIWAVARLIVLAVGRELFEVDGHSITLRREIAGVGRSMRFELGGVRNLHLAAAPPRGRVPPPDRGWPPLPQPLISGNIRFQFGSRTYVFGSGLGWPDMAAVMEALRERVPVASSSLGTD